MSQWIETYTGKKLFFLNPHPDDIVIDDIAHALSNQCRFSGHCKEFYSVAEHSVYVSKLLESKYKLAGLFHDAAEAYICDIPRPLKALLPEYMEVEDILMQSISDKFEFEYPLYKEVKWADIAQLQVEADHLMRSRGREYEDILQVDTGYKGLAPSCYSPDIAKNFFLDYYYELMGGQ